MFPLQLQICFILPYNQITKRKYKKSNIQNINRVDSSKVGRKLHHPNIATGSTPVICLIKFLREKFELYTRPM